MRVLYARIGQGHCPQCGRPITAQSREQIVARMAALPEGARFLVLAPVVRGQKGEFKDFCAEMLKRGYVRARIDGQVVRLADDLRLDKRIKHNIEIVIDRLRIAGRGLLLNADRRRQPAEEIDVGLGELAKELAGVARQRFDVAPLSLGVQRVEGE